MARTRSRFRGLNVKMIGAVLIGFALILGAFVFVQQGQQNYTVLIAQHQIPAGAQLVAGDLVPTTVSGVAPGGNLITNAEVQDFYGRVAVNSIAAGDAVRSSDFFKPIDPDASPNADGTPTYVYRLSEILGKDKRALVFLGTGDPTTAFVRVGDYIDILYSSTDPETGAVSIRVLMTKRVIYVVPQPDPAAGGGVGEPTPGAFIPDLTIAEAQALWYAEQTGTLKVALGNPESNQVQTEPIVVDQTYFDSTYGVTTGPAPSPSTEPVSSLPPLPLPSEAPATSPDASVTP
jgi:Flp pilus assembly protein CpaB